MSEPVPQEAVAAIRAELDGDNVVYRDGVPEGELAPSNCDSPVDTTKS